MIFRSEMRRQFLCGAAVVVAALSLSGAVFADDAVDVAGQYRAVLDAMKSPPTAGVLITEIGPESAAGKAGALGGDVITSYAGRNIADMQSLREGVAEVLASREVDNKRGKLLLGVRRGQKDVVLQIEPAPLGIRAIEVEAGVAAPLNPPPSLRGTITPEWGKLPVDGQKIYLRTNDPSTHTWIGWQERSVTLLNDSLSAKILVIHLDPGETPNSTSVSSEETLTCHVVLGDYKNSPAFVLDELNMKTEGDYQTVTTTASRVGGTLQTETGIEAAERNFAPVKTEHELPLDAVPGPLAPVVAASIAGQKDAVLGLSLLSVRDYVARPGYVLAAKDAEKIEGTEKPALRVDLMHCGITVEKYYFDEQRNLLRTDIGGGTGVTSVRASSQEGAELPVWKKMMPAATQK